ncbi:DEKNAAC100930 [Brettanomyces naardenensis]|uniref:DEKNAAC100930 n=1 Tax=Brettanomyces naardenensis TaxID=13370 RepID=A0A448YGU4_BRENA|nr:DEKNAAC100930 [Brettanomyces naardenensis]
MPIKASKPVKGTILVLHGFAQNSSGFAIKASGIRKALKKAGYHTVFIDGPLKLAAADMPFEVKSNGTPFEDLNLRGWTYTQPDRFDIQPSLDAVKAAYKEYGPFIGLLGFSQGAGIVGAILNKFSEIVDDDKAKLKFAMFYSGFRYKQESMEKFYTEKIKVPTLHVLGELDTVVSHERSQALIDQCENATVIKHPGGHYVPSTKELVNREVAWVERAVNGGEEEKKEEASEDKDERHRRELEELTKQMAKLGKVN